MAARNYRRQLLMLYEEDAGFEKGPAEKPAGFLKLEVRGSVGLLTSLVQNLKDIKDEGLVYKGFIGASEGPAFIDTGTIPVDGRGRGESSWRFDPENVGGTGYGIDSFDVFGVMSCKPANRGPGIACPLAGHTGKPREDWKELLRESFEEELHMPEPGEKVAQPSAPEPQQPPEALREGEPLQAPGALREGEPLQAPALREGEPEQPPGVLREGEPEHGTRQARPEPTKHSGLERVIGEALDFYPGVQPFERPEPGCRWWRINSYGYLFGIKYNQNSGIRYYIYGIPGVYNTQAHMQMEAYGFLKWHPLKGESHIPGERGYWLAYVDAKTGVLADPVT